LTPIAFDTLADPVLLAQALLRCASVTPEDCGAQAVLAGALEKLGFNVTPLNFGVVKNLYARIGTEGPHLCFAGHTDVVPPGNGAWTAGPFAGEVRDGVLYGRGACDMKGAIAAFVSGVAQHQEQGRRKGSISLLITGDEEGSATDGTVKVLEWMRSNNQIPDFCLVGEPTCPVRLGDMVKIGRRGSVNMQIEVHGTQGHVAYPNRADNPVHRLLQTLNALISAPLDAGTDWFEPSTLQVTSIDVGNRATNVIPAMARAALNIRFNDRHSGASLTAWVRATLARYAGRFDLASSISGESFVTRPGPLVDVLRQAIEGSTGIDPKLDTGGGTSDARFITNYCPVAEFGLVGATMHQADECVPVADLRELARIYRDIIAAFLA
jgi:succinyl-diaminopimelate desuccinylase